MGIKIIKGKSGMFKTVKNVFSVFVFIGGLFFTVTLAQASQVIYNLGKDAQSIDPQIATSSSGVQVISVCQEGLIRLDRNAEPIPGVAESWTHDKTGKIWTFKLRKNAEWSNGEPVTANDFAFGMKRALLPQTGAPYAFMLFYIKNAKEFNEQKLKNFSKVGIKVVDDHTLNIILNKPCPFFLYLMSFPVSYPLNEKFYNKIDGDNNYSLAPEDMLYNGPWSLTQSIPGDGGKYIFEKNGNYWNKKNIKIDKLIYLMISDSNTSSNMYVNNQMDVTEITKGQIPQIKGMGKGDAIHYLNAGGLWYLAFNINNKYFKNKNIRKAFSLAINRKVLCDFILKNGSAPAYGFVGPNVTGGKGIAFRKRFGEKLFNENAAEAKKLLDKGLKELGLKRPINVKLLYNTETQAQTCSEYIQEELRKNLNINVILDPSTYKNRLSRQRQHNFDFAFTTWGPDYNDPVSDLELLMTGNSLNASNYSNKKYDELIEKAKSTIDENKRMNYMGKAEKMMMADFPVAPIFYDYKIWLVNPKLKDWIITGGVGIITTFYWAHY
jgi:oligopeptide transport system substrate-binding protein